MKKATSTNTRTNTDTGKSSTNAMKEETERVVKALNDRLDSHDNNRKEVQEMLHSMCEVWKKEIDDLGGQDQQ